LTLEFSPRKPNFEKSSRKKHQDLATFPERSATANAD